ncbi:MAG: FHA domain-containing protein, partial [Candidatus Schekmanbacteria bacterium]|nr:FHA domain-containing protein [Candidatus Schekmanbacteria bacterium]
MAMSSEKRGAPNGESSGIDERLSAAPADDARLVIMDRSGGSWEHCLAGSSVRLGRDKANEVVLDHIEVSRFHARVSGEGATFVLEDVGSSNGTLLDGKKIHRAVLRHGAKIQIGGFTLLFRCAATSGDAPDDDEDQSGWTRLGRKSPLARESASGTPAASVEATQSALPRATAVVGPVPAAAEGSERDELDETQPGVGGPALMLVMIEGPGCGQELHFDQDRIQVGREEGLDVILRHDSVSRNHAVIIRTPLRFEVLDLGSSNGTRLNGTPVDRAPLASGDRLAFGDVVLEVRVAADAAMALGRRPRPKVLPARVKWAWVAMAVATGVASTAGLIGFLALRPTPSVQVASPVQTVSPVAPVRAFGHSTATSTDDRDVHCGQSAPGTGVPAESREQASQPGVRPREASPEPPEEDPVLSAVWEEYHLGGPDAAQERLSTLLGTAASSPGEDPAQQAAWRLSSSLRTLSALASQGEVALATGAVEDAARYWREALELEGESMPAEWTYLAQKLRSPLAGVEVERGKRQMAQ